VKPLKSIKYLLEEPAIFFKLPEKEFFLAKEK
jgi:hypothetical protein